MQIQKSTARTKGDHWLRWAAGLLLVFCVSCFGASWPFNLSQPVFVRGTYQEGHDATEPRPAESRYFKTEIAGFAIVNGVAGYRAFIDVITPPSQRIYTRAILENPVNSNTPIVYEHYIDPETGSTEVTHFPVIGLRIYNNYTITLIAYEDEARTVEIDRLKQEVRSYIDTTADPISIYSNIPM